MKNIEYITAGAGSGKTFTLTEKLANEIASGLKTDQVILTTFTKAAAEEFKIKAADKLNKKRLKADAQQLSGAMIGTIDSIAQTFVQKYWYLIGMSPELNVMGDAELEFYQVNSLIDSKLITPSALSLFDKVRKAFKIQKKKGYSYVDFFDFWKSDLLKIIQLSRNYGITDLKKSQTESFALIDNMFNNTTANPINWNKIFSLKSPVQKYKKLKSNPAVVADKTMDFSLGSNEVFSTLVTGSGLFKSKYYFDGVYIWDQIAGSNVYDINNGNTTFTTGNSNVFDKKCLDFINDCNDYLQSSEWGDILKQYVETICTIATKWQTQYSQYKTDHHLVDFNDIELKFKELLAQPQVVDDIKNQYKLVMVDEFQDCNPLQVEIFDTLSEIVASNPNGGKSIWVGDEKQSIYGFRGSDMRFIKSVIDKFPAPDARADADGLSQSTLPCSFRSRKKLVEKANDMVKAMFGNGTLEAVRKVATKTPVEDDLDYALGKSTPAIYNWHSIKKNKTEFYADVAKQVKILLDGTCPSMPNDILKEFETKKDASGETICDANKIPIYDETKQVIKKNSISAGDIAILVRKGSDVNSIVDALNGVGVKVNAVEGDIKSMAEIQLMMAILNYSLAKNDYSRAQILYLWDNKKVEDIIEDKLNKVSWATEKVLTDIDQILLDSKGMSVFQLIETLLLRLDIWNHVAKWGNASRRHANINTFLRIAQGYEEHTRLLDLACSMMGFINYFDSDSVSADTPFVKDPEAVSVITYHKSKGLEWPIVILDSLDNDPLDEKKLISKEYFGIHNYSTNPAAIDCASRGEYLTIFPPLVADNANLPAILEAKIANRVQKGGDIYDKIKEEEARLLYVGFTRARDYAVTIDYDTSSSYKLLGIYDIKKILVDETNTDNVIFKTDIPTMDPAAASPTYDIIKNTPLNPGSSTLPRYVSPSKLGKGHAPANAQNPVAVSTPITLSVGKVPMNEVGTCIHDIYAVYDEKIAANDMVAKAKQICEMHNRNDIKPHTKEFVDAIKKLYEYLTKTYGGHTDIYHELPVMHKTANQQIMNGEIDLLWCLPGNKAIIVDFKSMKDDNVVASDQDLIDKGNHYANQLCAYKEAVEKAGITVESMILFFPMQGKIVELK